MNAKYSQMHKVKMISGLIALLGLIAWNAAPAEAGRGGYRWITAQSEFDFRTVSGPIRPGPNGNQVRLPGGTWLNCEYSCEYTLRSNTLDFFICGEGADDSCSPGILDDLIARRLH